MTYQNNSRMNLQKFFRDACLGDFVNNIEIQKHPSSKKNKKEIQSHSTDGLDGSVFEGKVQRFGVS